METRRPRPFQVPDLVLLPLFLLVALGGCLDFKLPLVQLNITYAHLYVCYGVIGLLLLTDREGPLRSRLIVTLAGLLLTILHTYAMRHATDHYSLRLVTRLVLRSPSIYLWAIALWFASPILLNRGSQRYSRGLQYSVLALCLYGSLCFSSAATSVSPKHSLLPFYQERAVLFGVLFPWLRAAHCSGWLREQTGRWMAYFFGVTVILAAILSLTYLLGGKPMRAWLHNVGVIYIAPYDADPTLPCQRLLFPVFHFNRTALFMLVATMAMIVSFFSVVRERWLGRVALALAFVAMVLLIQTYTRGAIVAALAGICLLGCLLSRKVFLALLVGSILLIMLMPANRRDHILSVFRYTTYTSEVRKTSMGDRILAWKWGLRMIEEHPWSGLGYGTKIIRNAYLGYAKEIRDPRLIKDIESDNVMQHLHNTILEVAAESGVPAALAFACFAALRWLMLFKTWRGATGMDRARFSAWIAFECAILIYCMIFYMLKKNFGFMTWLVWFYILSETDARIIGARSRGGSLQPKPILDTRGKSRAEPTRS